MASETPKVLIEVSGGVAECTYTRPGMGKPDVEILDWDNVKASEYGEYGSLDEWVWEIMERYSPDSLAELRHACGVLGSIQKMSV